MIFSWVVWRYDNVAVYSDAQQIVFEPGEGEVRVEYGVHFGGEPEEFGWVIPVPGEVLSVDEGDPERFAHLDLWTDPDLILEEPFSLACSGKNDAAGGVDSGTWRGVVGSGTAGIFDWVALESDTSAPLLEWLEAEGFDVGSASTSIDAYVSQGSFQFLALRMNGSPDEADSGWGSRAPMASLALTYSGSTLLYPAQMSLGSSQPTQATTVYVLGDQRASISGWDSEEVGTLVGDIDDSPSDLYAERIESLGGENRVYGLVFAGRYRALGELHNSGDWVTRFDSSVASSAHTVDPHFVLDGGEVEVRSTIELYESERKRERAASRASLVLPMLLAGLLGIARRR